MNEPKTKEELAEEWASDRIAHLSSEVDVTWGRALEDSFLAGWEAAEQNMREQAKEPE